MHIVGLSWINWDLYILPKNKLQWTDKHFAPGHFIHSLQPIDWIYLLLD